jgi:hypothetical protein
MTRDLPLIVPAPILAVELGADPSLLPEPMSFDMFGSETSHPLDI